MYRGLDSFRALAFLAVFATHCGLFPPGYLGVQAFFVLSGFLLTPIILAMKDQLSSRNFFLHFYGRRILRIFPLYYMYMLVVWLVSVVIVHTSIEMQGIVPHVGDQMPWALTYTFDFLNASKSFEQTPWFGHLWSLSVEEQFYLIWPGLLFIVSKNHLNKFLLASILMGPVLRLLITIIQQSGTLFFLAERTDLVIYCLPFSHYDAFAIGGYFALYKTSDKSNVTTLALLYLTILIGYVTQYLATGSIDLFTLGYSYALHDQYIWGYSLINLVFAKVIAQFKDGKFFPVLFDSSILRYLGKISYGLYVFHLPILALVAYVNPSLSARGVALVSFGLTILVGALSYELFEKRFLGLKTKFFPKEVAA